MHLRDCHLVDGPNFARMVGGGGAGQPDAPVEGMIGAVVYAGPSPCNDSGVAEAGAVGVNSDGFARYSDSAAAGSGATR